MQWAIGEGAGEFAAYSSGRNFNTHEFLKPDTDLTLLYDWLVNNCGIPMYWYDDVTFEDKDFGEAQMKPFKDTAYHADASTLHYHE